MKHHDLSANLSDDVVVSKATASAMLNISHDTLERLIKRGEAPKRVKVTPARFGYRMRDIRTWLNERAG
jgi:predicted DNA-binding transcriptional regulator AlpA